MPIDSRRVERIVGFFVILLLVVTSVLVFMLLRQRDWFAKKFEVRAVFEKGTAVSEGTPVLIEGIQVGRVKKLRFNMANQMEGIFAINVRYRRQLRKDSVATVIRSHFLGAPQIEISVGSTDEPLLTEGDLIPAIATTEPSMKDFLSLATNVVSVARDLRDPQGSFQQILRNVEEVTRQAAQGSGSIPSILKDDGGFYNDTRSVVGDFSGMLKGRTSVPITLTTESHIYMDLSEKLDKQTDVFVKVAEKLDKICDRLLSRDNMAGALLSDPEFYRETRQFLREGREFLMDLQQLAVDLRAVVPELPGLIDEGKADLKEMGRVLRGIQRLPFVGVGEEPAPKPQTLQLPGRLNMLEESKR